MKKKDVFLGLLVCVLILFTHVSCDSDNGSSTTPETVTFTSREGGATYTLVVSKNINRATYSPVTGDTYVLTITKAGSPAKTSSGTVTVSTPGTNTVLNLSGGVNLTVTISNGGEMLRIEGTITTNAGNEEAPGEVAPYNNDDGVSGSIDDQRIIGKWDGTYKELVYEFTYKADGTYEQIAVAAELDYEDRRRGTYATSNGILTETITHVYISPMPYPGNPVRWYTVDEFREIQVANGKSPYPNPPSFSNPYSINGDTLTLMGDSRTLECTRRR